jgi:predicted nucleic acid-binding protein
MKYFFDTSALVKVYHREDGTDIVLPIYKSDDQIFLSELSKLEFISTIHKKFRNKWIDKKVLKVLKEKFFSDVYNRFYILPLSSLFLDNASELIEEYGESRHLISLDAIQLATFSSIADDVIFTCGDSRLNSLVKLIGFNVMEV